MIETNLNKKLCKNPELIEVLTQIHTPHSYLLPLFFSLLSSGRIKSDNNIMCYKNSRFSCHRRYHLNEFYIILFLQKNLLN